MKPLAVLLLLVCCAFGQSKDITDENGTDWHSSTQAFKIGYVEGYISAMTYAQINAAFLCSFGLNLKPDSEDSNKCGDYARSLYFAKMTVGQIVDGMDAFYKDFRNIQYPMHAAIRMVRDEINGRPGDDIEKELTAWRQCRADSSKCGIPTNSNQTPPATKK